ncbi:hypothetical protein NKDENANG_04102 [Candidatus Entotheonellaceae bacterium PAL068K]
MADNNLELMAHLMRRAGFGARRDELEAYAEKGYEAVVEDLLHPERFPEVDNDLFCRYYSLGSTMVDAPALWHGRWLYRMINTQRPLEEKMALFWHHVFATGWHKSENTPSMVHQIDTFRGNGLSDLRTILLDLSRDPAMLDWLDNNENHEDAPNENYGRELLELFSMGMGNYTESDIKNAARAFTGWSFAQPIPLYPYGYYSTAFVYRKDDHDDSEKTFLGHTGRLGGEDIIAIIVQQPATARFIARHLYNFFVADEPQVPSWNQTPPQDPDAIETLSKAYFESNGSLRFMLRELFNADFFKAARFKRVKSPNELIAGTIKLVGTHRFPEPGLHELATAATAMGQGLLNPPTVEGWHTGKEWIDGGTLNERVNFAVSAVADVTQPGIQAIIERLRARGTVLDPEALVDDCLDLIGPLPVGDQTRQALCRYAAAGGELCFDTDVERQASCQRIGRLLQLIVASQEYQFA